MKPKPKAVQPEKPLTDEEKDLVGKIVLPVEGQEPKGPKKPVVDGIKGYS